MGSYSKAMASVIQGMSQQPDRFMIDGQCREQINAVSSAVEGVVKRPSAEYLATMTWLDPNKDYKHFGLQIGGKSYNISMDTSFLYLAEDLTLIATFDLTGNVNGYIGDDLDSLKLYYLDDIIYILNNNRIVYMQETDAVTHNISSTISITGVDTDKTVNVNINVYQVSDGTLVESNAFDYYMESGDTVNDVATALYNAFIAGSSTYLNAAVRRSVMTVRLQAAYVEDYYVTIEVDDEAYNTYAVGVGESVNETADLPTRGYAGQRVKVNAADGEEEDIYFMFLPNGDAESEDLTDDIVIDFAYDNRSFSRSFNTDSQESVKIVADFESTQETTVTAITSSLYTIYKEDDTELVVGDTVNIGIDDATELKFVRTTDGAGAALGTWIETAEAGTNTLLNMSMPAVLYATTEDNVTTWTLEESEWAARNAGNTTSSEDPAFVGKTIQSLFETAGRLIITHTAGSYLSEVANSSNMFRVTAADLLTTDAYSLDGSNLAGNLSTPISLNGTIYVWGDQEQLRVDGTTLSITTSALNGVSKYSSDSTVDPIVTGDAIHYITRTNKYSVVHTYNVKPGTNDSMGSEAISDQIATLITGQVKQLISNYSTNSLFVLTEDEPNKLFMYNYYTIDNTLRQSAWSILEFDFNIEYIYVNDNSFRMIVNADNNYQLLELDLKDLTTPESILLDFKQELTFTNGTASVAVLLDDMIVVDNQDYKGQILTYTDNGDGTITCPALLEEDTYTCYIGLKFTTSYKPRQPVDTTQSGNDVYNITKYIQYMGLTLGLTGQYTVTIEGDGFSDTMNYNLSEIPVDITDFPEHEYEERVAIMAKSGQDLDITITSDNHFPFNLKNIYYDYSTAQRRTTL